MFKDSFFNISFEFLPRNKRTSTPGAYESDKRHEKPIEAIIETARSAKSFPVRAGKKKNGIKTTIVVSAEPVEERLTS